jgi:hypothetical protein
MENLEHLMEIIRTETDPKAFQQASITALKLVSQYTSEIMTKTTEMMKKDLETKKELQ